MKGHFAVILVAGLLAGCTTPAAVVPTPTPANPPVATPEVKARRVPIKKDKAIPLTRRGQSGVVTFADGQGNAVPSGATEKALDRLIDLYRAGDTQGWGGMILSGRAMMIEDGTHALLIDPGFAVHEIRLLDGRHAGRSAFIPAECLIAE